jgi:hypothetical protein
MNIEVIEQSYTDFLKSKMSIAPRMGIDIDKSEVNPPPCAAASWRDDETPAIPV